MSDSVPDRKAPVNQRAEWVFRVLGIRVAAAEESTTGAAPAGSNDVAISPTEPNRKDAFSIVRFTKAQLAWRAERTAALAEIDHLSGQLASVYEGAGLGVEFLGEFDKFVAPVRAELGSDVDDLLDAVRTQADASERGKALALVHQRAQALTASLRSSPVIAVLERSPVSPATFRQPLEQGLRELLRLSEA